ncbi:MAG: hypothetical protein ACM357_06340 [Gemmatimonadota bacterium]
MTHRRLYSTAVIAGILLGLGLAFWRRAGGGSTGEMIGWAVGGFAVAIVLAFVAGIGMRLQRRDIPEPRAADVPGTRETGRLDDE